MFVAEMMLHKLTSGCSDDFLNLSALWRSIFKHFHIYKREIFRVTAPVRSF